MRSFLRRPRESSRTRAVAVVGMSRTTSPRASSHNAKWCPSPSASSFAHARSGHALAQTIRRWYSVMDASMRNDPTSELVAGSSAVAVWVDLCGSTPVTVMEYGARGTQPGGGDTPQQGQPELRVTGITRVIPSVLLRHAMGCKATHRPVTLIQVGIT